MADTLIPIERIAGRIFVIRGEKVMLDFDLAELYGVPTKVLNQAVSRNRKRFPEDFMFRLSAEEIDASESQIVTSSWRRCWYALGLRRRLNALATGWSHDDLAHGLLSPLRRDLDDQGTLSLTAVCSP